MKLVVFENVFFASSFLALVKNSFIDEVYSVQLVLLFSNKGTEFQIFCP